MSKCIDCKYSQDSEYEIAGIMCCTCALTRRVMNANVESECNCFNRDLSGYDICYNCKYYIGGGDWGLFCSHKDMYHHLGKFSDEPCKRYERRAKNEKAEAISILATSVRPREAKDRARYDKAVKMAIEALNCSEFPNNSDTISRQAAIDAIVNTVSEVGNHDNSEVARYGATFRQHEILDIIESLPPAQPRKGKWIETEFLKLRECSCCHVRWGMYDVENFDFCPSCGSYNGGKNEA